MSDPKAQQEPSMEEILASIRRIISEDEEAPDGEQPEAGAVEEVASAEPEPEPEPEAEAEPEIEAGVDDEFAEIDFAPSPALEAVDDDGSDDDVVEEPAVEEDEQDDVLELTELADEDVTDAEPDDLAEMPADDALVSEDTEQEAASSLSRLSETIVPAAAGSLAAGINVGGADSLEALVRQLLRPLLREWLDDNLPGIVEEAVEQEVKRLSRSHRGRG